MPIDERDYMRDVPEYRRLVGRGDGGGPLLPPGSTGSASSRGGGYPAGSARSSQSVLKTRPWAWFLLGVMATLAVSGAAANHWNLTIERATDPIVVAPLAAAPSHGRKAAGRKHAQTRKRTTTAPRTITRTVTTTRVVTVAAPTPTAPATGTPVQGPEYRRIRGPATGTLGGYMTTSGTLGNGISGPVVVEARWPGEPWQMLASSYAQNGQYRVRWSLLKRGEMHVRIALPDGNYAVTTINVQ